MEMAAVQSANGSSSRERGPLPNGQSQTRSRNDNERASSMVSNGTVLRTEIENRAPPGPRPPPDLSGFPRGLGGMLKTGTETGEIGMFSIKPPRVRPSPNPPGSPRRMMGNNGPNYTSHNGRYGGHQGVDDRRRLPSYTRDASSEVISMYETASQKSPRRRHHNDFEDRSNSMTQPYSQYGMSNHRSYSSLRSQQEGAVQRPISPFAYPARLRRPGFRPSSPALTDGGVVDYARRAEIERAQHVGFPFAVLLPKVYCAWNALLTFSIGTSIIIAVFSLRPET